MSNLDLFAGAGDGVDPSHFGLTEDGVPYVVASKFAAALGYSKTQNATDSLDPEEKGYAVTVTPGGTQRVGVIYEDGIWELIFRSTLPSAKAIKLRVKSILRQLRQTGVVDTREKPLTEIEVARKYLAALERVAELEPAAQSWETLADASGDYSMREAAQILDRDPAIKTGQNRLSRYLREIGWVDRHGTPYQRTVDPSFLVLRTRSYDHPRTGEAQVTSQIRITVKGLHALHKRLGGSGPLLLAA
jgi:prophage antirepressor-like protein